MSNKKKIINDPVFGFITIPNEFIYSLVQHPILQRLNRIKQLGLASFVYPGAQHTRLHHSIGSMYLMDEAIKNFRLRGHKISSEEENGALACILLHDIGHGPFSHVLEHTLIQNIHHEKFSLALMENLNSEMNGVLDVCIAIFKDKYPKRFLHQLVSGQLDADRLDYLRRDSYFTGVSEGNIGSVRIIKMLDIRNDSLVVEAKGIYSIENFLLSRRLMYWQVYFHKTAVSAEKMMIKTFNRAKELMSIGNNLFASPSLKYFLSNDVDESFFENHRNEVLRHFVNLDDSDIWCALKVWAENEDIILSVLSKCILNRNLFKIKIDTTAPDTSTINKLKNQYIKQFSISDDETNYLFSVDEISTNMYNEADDCIGILYNDGTIKNVAEASDMLNIHLLSKTVKKYYLSYLKIDAN